MTVPVPSQLVYSDSGDGVTTTFSFPVRFLDKAEVVVLLRDVATGVDTKQVPGSDYTIAGSSWPTGGNIVFNTAPPVGTEVIRYRETVAKQVVDLANTQRNDAEAVETQLDRLAMVQQDQKQELARALKADIGESGLTVESVPEGHFWLAGPDGRMIDGGSAADIAAAQGYAAEAKDAQAAAEAAQQGAEDAALDAALDADRAQSYAAMLSADKVKFPTVAGLIADEVMSYTTGAGLIEVGASDIIEAGGYRYEVAADDAVDHHVDTAGGVKLYVLPSEDGSIAVKAFGEAADGTTDDYDVITKSAAVAAAINAPLVLTPCASYATSDTIDFSDVEVVFAYNVTFYPMFDEGIAVQWVAASNALKADRKCLGNLRVVWPAADWTKDRTSFYIKNSYHGEYHLSSTFGTRGIVMEGDERGCVYNHVFIGVMYMNLIGALLTTATSTGWCNANVIWGGRWYGAGNAAGSLYESQAGHIVIDDSLYLCNGNHFIRNSLEWGGFGFRLARLAGYSNSLQPSYCELPNGDATWIVDTGTKNVLDLRSTTSDMSYAPNLPGASNRVDVSGAVRPAVLGNTEYKDTLGPNYTLANNPQPTETIVNRGVGPALALQNAGGSTRDALRILDSAGDIFIGIPAFGPWTVAAGTRKVQWYGASAPSTGTWTRGDIIFFTNPSAGGKIGAVCVTSGTPGTWKEFGAIDA